MATRQKRNSLVYRLMFPVFCIGMSAYFYHHSTIGKYGSLSHIKYEDKTMQYEFKLAALRVKKEEIASRVKLMRNGSIERDMLDEQVRYQLNLLNKDEIVLMRSAEKHFN